MQSMHAVTGTQAADLLQQAREATLLARRDEALELLTACAEWPQPYNEQGLLLRAQVLYARDAIAGLQELAAHADAFTSAAGRIGYLLTSARAYMKARNFEAAESMLQSAAEALDNAVEAPHHELAYLRARLCWIRREYDPQNPDIALALHSQDPELRFNAFNVRAWMHAGLEDYRAMMSDLRACIQVYREHGHRCGLSNVALCLQTMLGLGFELGDRDAERDAEAALETIQWTRDIEVHRFLCLRALAWYAFLRGDSARAQWLFKDSKDDAPTPAWKVMAHVDRAYVARMNLNEAWAAEELHEAHAIARTVEWRSTRDEERTALITLALLLAPVDLGQAQRYVSTYIELGSDNLNPTIEASHEPRRTLGAQQYAAGRVHAMLGNANLAVRNLEQAYEIFAAIEFDFRAAVVAQELHGLTKDERWLRNAQVHAAKFPNSALAQRLAGEEGRSRQVEMEGLSPTQRQIAIAHCQGLSNTELSRRFSRSTFTIEKQIEEIYGAFGVQSRTGLREELHRRGVL